MTLGRSDQTATSRTSIARSSKNRRTEPAISRSPGPPYAGLTLLMRTNSESVSVTEGWGGRVGAESVPGQTRFWFSLPPSR